MQRSLTEHELIVAYAYIYTSFPFFGVILEKEAYEKKNIRKSR